MLDWYGLLRKLLQGLISIVCVWSVKLENIFVGITKNVSQSSIFDTIGFATSSYIFGFITHRNLNLMCYEVPSWSATLIRVLLIIFCDF